ncbi:MAG TPA: hypothetical protein VG605_02120 [Puia sp.]|nr:hypothetical protein [Puia sp.]
MKKTLSLVAFPLLTCALTAQVQTHLPSCNCPTGQDLAHQGSPEIHGVYWNWNVDHLSPLGPVRLSVP